MPDTQSILASHNRLCLIVSSVLGSTQELPQLLALKGEVEEMVMLVNEVRDHISIFCTGSTDGPRG